MIEENTFCELLNSKYKVGIDKKYDDSGISSLHEEKWYESFITLDKKSCYIKHINKIYIRNK